MNMTYNNAIALLKSGKQDEAWDEAKKDEGMLPEVTKRMWLSFAYSKLAARDDSTKLLKALRHDSGNCRLYVQCSKRRKYVILDQGHTYEKAGLPRFELYAHTSDGEPDYPISSDWYLVEGAECTPFYSGLCVAK